MLVKLNVAGALLIELEEKFFIPGLGPKTEQVLLDLAIKNWPMNDSTRDV